MSANEIYMARQPIYDLDNRVVAYELLYRKEDWSCDGTIDAQESAQALVNGIVDIGLNRLCGDSKAFVNVGEDLLFSDVVNLLPPRRVVIELASNVEPTTEAVLAIERLHKAGFMVALDDFEANEKTRPFLNFASIVKLDVSALGSNIATHVAEAKRPGVTFLGAKVDSKEARNSCENWGFTMFQGHFFACPQIVHGTTIPPNRLAALEIVAKLQSPESTLDEIEQLIVADLALSYRLIQLVKSAHVGLPQRVATIRGALLFLGMNTVASLASLLAMAATSSKPPELLVTALSRAKMCQKLAQMSSRPDPDRYFTVGLFSVLDALLDAPMADILAQLPLDSEVTDALLDRRCTNHLGAVLRMVLYFESGDWDNVVQHERPVAEAYYESVHWASAMAKQVGGPSSLAA